MRFLTYQFTDPGGRSPNEDSVGFLENGGIHAWIAADGLGGHSHGELASRKAVETMADALAEPQEFERDYVSGIFRKMNDAVNEMHGPLTTAVCAFSDGRKLFYGNNGDSRFIFIRNREVLHHSNDHSLAYLAYKSGKISYDEIPEHPAQNRLYHSLGFESEFAAELYPPVTLQPGDAFILCTDGFWELLTENEMIRTLNISPNAEEWMNMLLDILRTRLKPTSDNYTAVCVIVRED